MRSRSKKRARKEDAAKEIRRAFLASRPWCEFQSPKCTGRSQDVHERLPRSAGGSLTEIDNLASVCRACHDYAHGNPIEAYSKDWLRSRYSPGVEEILRYY